MLFFITLIPSKLGFGDPGGLTSQVLMTLAGLTSQVLAFRKRREDAETSVRREK
jgi:hypothetical protein